MRTACPAAFLFMRQLPPATGKAPFVVDPRVRNFAFRVLRQNRRVVTDESRRAELELFHEVLTDISMCRSTQSVREFIIAAYVRGASTGTAENTSLEGNTAVFTKRRYRDAWNRCVTRRVSKSHCHSVKIKSESQSSRDSRAKLVWGQACQLYPFEGSHAKCVAASPCRRLPRSL